MIFLKITKTETSTMDQTRNKPRRLQRYTKRVKPQKTQQKNTLTSVASPWRSTTLQKSLSLEKKNNEKPPFKTTALQPNRSSDSKDQHSRSRKRKSSSPWRSERPRNCWCTDHCEDDVHTARRNRDDAGTWVKLLKEEKAVLCAVRSSCCQYAARDGERFRRLWRAPGGRCPLVGSPWRRRWWKSAKETSFGITWDGHGVFWESSREKNTLEMDREEFN